MEGEQFKIHEWLRLILFCLASLVLLCVFGMALKFAGADWDKYLSLGGYDNHAASKITQSLKECAPEAHKICTC